MRTQDVLEHFKSQTAVAKALGIRQSSVAEWGEFPPPLRQVQLEALTEGQLKAERECLPQPASEAPPEKRGGPVEGGNDRPNPNGSEPSAGCTPGSSGGDELQERAA